MDCVMASDHSRSSIGNTSWRLDEATQQTMELHLCAFGKKTSNTNLHKCLIYLENLM